MKKLLVLTIALALSILFAAQAEPVQEARTVRLLPLTEEGTCLGYVPAKAMLEWGHGTVSFSLEQADGVDAALYPPLCAAVECPENT